MKRGFYLGLALISLYSASIAAQTCSRTISGTVGSTMTFTGNTCGLNSALTNVCGSVVLNSKGTAIFSVPVGISHGNIDFTVFSSSFTPFIALQRPGGCDPLTPCVFADENVGSVHDVLANVESAGTYHFLVGDAEIETPGCGSFTATISGNFGLTDQTISFSSTAPTDAIAGVGSYQVFASASSGLPVQLGIDSASTSDCSLTGSTSGSRVNYKRSGLCIIDANQSGDASHTPAPQVQQTFNVSASTPAELIFTGVTSPIKAGSAFSPAIQIELVDSYGNVVTTDNTHTVSLTSTVGDTGLTGGGPQTFINGIATFPSVILTKASDVYGLRAISNAGTSFSTILIRVIAGDPATVKFMPDPPSNGVAGAFLPGTLGVTEYDIFDNPVLWDSTSLISLVANGPGRLTSEPVTSPAINGAANFNHDLVLNKSGTYTLTASSSFSSAILATSKSFAVAPSSGSTLQFTPVPPSSIEQGTTLGEVTVTEFDSFGNRVLSDSSTVVSLSSSACGNTMLGSAALSGGRVKFNAGTHFNTLASNLALSAMASGSPAPSPASASFDVVSSPDYLFSGSFEGCSP